MGRLSLTEGAAGGALSDADRRARALRGLKLVQLQAVGSYLLVVVVLMAKLYWMGHHHLLGLTLSAIWLVAGRALTAWLSASLRRKACAISGHG